MSDATRPQRCRSERVCSWRCATCASARSKPSFTTAGSCASRRREKVAFRGRPAHRGAVEARIEDHLLGSAPDRRSSPDPSPEGLTCRSHGSASCSSCIIGPCASLTSPGTLASGRSSGDAAAEPAPLPEELGAAASRFSSASSSSSEEQRTEKKKSATAGGRRRPGRLRAQVRERATSSSSCAATCSSTAASSSTTTSGRRPTPSSCGAPGRSSKGTVFKIFDFQIMPDFGGGQSVLYDAYLEARFSPAFRVRAGKFKPPVGLERLQSATDLVFVERAAPTVLVPNRDVGVQLGGELAGASSSTPVGVFNGVVDGGIADTATVRRQGVRGAALLASVPARATAPMPAIDLGLGVAASRGEQDGTVARRSCRCYRTTGSRRSSPTAATAPRPGTVVRRRRRARARAAGLVLHRDRSGCSPSTFAAGSGVRRGIRVEPSSRTRPGRSSSPGS